MTDCVSFFLYIIHAPRHLNATLPFLITPDVERSVISSRQLHLLVPRHLTSLFCISSTHDDLYHGCNSPSTHERVITLISRTGGAYHTVCCVNVWQCVRPLPCHMGRTNSKRRHATNPKSNMIPPSWGRAPSAIQTHDIAHPHLQTKVDGRG